MFFYNLSLQFSQFETDCTCKWRILRNFFFYIAVVSLLMFVFDDPLNFWSTCHERTSKTYQTVSWQTQVWWQSVKSQNIRYIGHKACLCRSRNKNPVCWFLLSEPSTHQTSFHPVFNDTGDFSQLKTIKHFNFLGFVCGYSSFFFFFLVSMFNSYWLLVIVLS